MAWQSGVGLQLPGVTSDGKNGLNVADALNAGDLTKEPQPDFHQFTGSTTFQDAFGSFTDEDSVLVVLQKINTNPSGNGNCAAYFARSGDVSAGDYSDPAFLFNDATTSATPVFQVKKQNVVVLELKARQSITGALSTVTDAAAKAVLTSIIAALTGIKVANNNTI